MRNKVTVFLTVILAFVVLAGATDKILENKSMKTATTQKA